LGLKTTKTYTLLLSPRIVLLFGFIFLLTAVGAQDYNNVVDLAGNWKFSIGDDPDWADPDYDDSHWERIQVPSNWESQGFHGYDGYAWYRLEVTLPEDIRETTLYLELGYIDDVDETYVNGTKIGQSGRFPPGYETAHRARRLYLIPQRVREPGGMLCIAVRVFDAGGEGGFIHGESGILVDRASIQPDFSLAGTWKFNTGNCSDSITPDVYASWSEIEVPGIWEDQGYKYYDGLACYATDFQLDGQFNGQRMILLLGKIDDLDKVFLNGHLIGQFGLFNEQTVKLRPDAYNQLRAYFIPPDLLHYNRTNILTVKVLDLHGSGGIWDGTVGLITQDNYILYWHGRR
jgi:sialate O-acetylesterase